MILGRVSDREKSRTQRLARALGAHRPIAGSSASNAVRRASSIKQAKSDLVSASIQRRATAVTRRDEPTRRTYPCQVDHAERVTPMKTLWRRRCDPRKRKGADESVEERGGATRLSHRQNASSATSARTYKPYIIEAQALALSAAYTARYQSVVR